MAMSRRVSGGGRRVWVGKESGAKYAPVSIWATFGHLPQRQWEGQHHIWHAALALERLRPLQITQGRLTDERTESRRHTSLSFVLAHSRVRFLGAGCDETQPLALLVLVFAG
jgi:hypothetical protein